MAGQRASSLISQISDFSLPFYTFKSLYFQDRDKLKEPNAKLKHTASQSATNRYYYLAGCTMFPHLPAPTSQLCNLPPPIVSISPIFFL
jgi:hypothetical protein